MIAVNDGVILRNQIPRILKKHFRDTKYYVDLLDLFNEVKMIHTIIIKGLLPSNFISIPIDLEFCQLVSCNR